MIGMYLLAYVLSEWNKAKEFKASTYIETEEEFIINRNQNYVHPVYRINFKLSVHRG